MAGLYVLTILYLSYLNVINVDLLNPLQNDRKSLICEPNKLYKTTKENITCTCTEKGEWPNDECYSYFQTLNSYEPTCEPGGFIILDCNVCRCDHNGKVNKDQCTQHECGTVESSRRSISIEGSCEPKRWYSFAPCRICYCVNKHKLVCNNEYKRSKIHVEKYELSECSGNLLFDMKELTSEKRALRFDNKNEIIENNVNGHSSSDSEENTHENEEQSTSTHNPLKAKVYKANNKMVEEENDFPSVRRKVKKSKSKKVNSDIDWNNSSNKNQSHVLRIKLPNIFDDIFNLVLRKSLSINSGSKCKPGTHTQVGCNNCFCLTNGKQLCTEKQCQ